MRNISKRRARVFRINARKADAYLPPLGGLRIPILEPWQYEPIDRTVLHLVSIEYREAFPDARATCTCGLDRGWQSAAAAEDDARWHQEQACPFPDPSL